MQTENLARANLHIHWTDIAHALHWQENWGKNAFAQLATLNFVAAVARFRQLNVTLRAKYCLL